MASKTRQKRVDSIVRRDGYFNRAEDTRPKRLTLQTLDREESMKRPVVLFPIALGVPRAR